MGRSALPVAGRLSGTGSPGYSSWLSSDGTNDQIVDNPERHDCNIDQYVDKSVQYATAQSFYMQTDPQMWPCGTDFQHTNAVRWYQNLDKSPTT